MRAAKRPAAAQGDVYSQPKLFGFLSREAQRINVFIGKEREVVKSSLRVIQSKWVQGGNLDTSNPCRFHLLEFPRNFGFRHPRSKPPPAHHNPRVPRRMCKRFRQLAQME